MQATIFRVLITISGILFLLKIGYLLPRFSLGRWLWRARERNYQAYWSSRILPAAVAVNIGALLREYTPFVKYIVPSQQEVIGSGILLLYSILFFFERVPPDSSEDSSIDESEDYDPPDS
jgi:hypothetical protein